MKYPNFACVGHIFFIAPDSGDWLDTLARWTVQWILRNEIPIDTTIYTCSSLEQANETLAEPLAAGSPPALVVIDHTNQDPAITRFGELLRSCIPETWVIEMVTGETPLPQDGDQAFLVHKPIRRGDWEDVLQHVFVQARSPQWSRAQ